MATMPRIVTPRPACASVIPIAERGRPANRDMLVPRGDLNRAMRCASSYRLPRMSQKPRARPGTASHGARLLNTTTSAATSKAEPRTGSSFFRAGERLARFQLSNPPTGMSRRSRQHDGAECQVEIGRADRDLHAEHFHQQWIERTDQHCCGSGAEEQVVENKHAFPAHWCKLATGFQSWCSPGIDCKRTANEEQQDEQL